VKRIDQTRFEWALLGVIAIVCAGLSILQYRWTVEASRAELARLRAGLDEQVHRLVRAFDDQIRESCTILMPEAREVRQEGRELAHRTRYESWAATHDRVLFTRMGVAVPEQGILKLYGIDGAGHSAPMDWPAGWETLRVAMIARMKGAGPPPASLDSSLIEMPVLDYALRPDNSGPEVEWMILEVNQDYVRGKILPALIAEYLNHTGEPTYDVSMSWAEPPGELIFSTRTDHTDVLRGAEATAGIFAANNGVLPARRRRWLADNEPLFRWKIAVRHRVGSLDAAVSRARTRNLVTSFALIALLGGAAWALVRFTGRSRRLAEMQFRFAAGVSHDLRTPLTAIRGAAFNLADGVVNEPAAVARYAKLILRNAEELTAMIENVLAFSATLRSDAEARSETFAIGDLLEHAAGVMEQEVEQAGCRIELNVAPDLPSVAGDPASLDLAFRNLITNAIRHAAQGGWIGVSAGRSADGVEIRVSDRGPGIPDPERERIFEPFYRGEQTRAHRVPGTGLGLSLVKNTVERHHGSITVHNSPGGGAQFTLRLPAVPELV